MTLKSEIEKDVLEILSTTWKERDGYVVPTDSSVSLGNNAVKLDATVLYADLSGSTAMVNRNAAFISAEIYKSFLICAAKIIRGEGGEITAYDGDRIMAVYVSERKNTRAAISALKIHWTIANVVNPAIARQYPLTADRVNHVVGIDTSGLFVAKTGVRGANDLVWVGRAANYAAKLTELPASHRTYITKEVYDALAPDARLSTNQEPMWEATRWQTHDNSVIYRSNFWWEGVSFAVEG